jgi:hypothetical protein
VHYNGILSDEDETSDDDKPWVGPRCSQQLSVRGRYFGAAAEPTV